MLGIIGGSGLTQLANLEVTGREVARTPFGEPSGAIIRGRMGNKEVAFIARHGYGHTIPPHLVNYRANVWALAHVAEVDGLVAVASVGGIRGDLGPGTLVLPDQIIDYTSGRKTTFHEGPASVGKQVVHIDFTEPYDAQMRRCLLDAAAKAGVPLADGAVYAATQGPRLETRSEINRLEADGAHVVGMTGMPEACLARELGLPYAAICPVANWAAGRGDSGHVIHMQAIEAVLRESLGQVRRIFEVLCQ